MSFDVKTESGVVTANIAPGAYMDAGRSGEIAGLEFAATSVHAFDSPRSERHAPLVVTLDFSPATGRALCFLLADKMGLPLLTEGDWRTVCHALRIMDAECKRVDGEALAERIERSWDS